MSFVLERRKEVMIRKLKALGLAVVASFALTAVVASPASADFISESHHTLFSGSQVAESNHVFTVDPGTTTCKKAAFSGTQSGTTSESVTVEMAYSECTLKTIFGNVTVTVNPNGCHYLFTTSGVVHITCPEGKEIVVSGPGCTVRVPAQTVEGNIFTNEGSETTRDITVHTDVTNEIDYSYSGFTCGSGTGTTNGSYTGQSTIRGFDTNGNHVGVWSAH